jgi:hypothetical protein
MMLEINALAALVEKFAPTLAASLLHESGKIFITVLEKIFGVSREDLIKAITDDPDSDKKLSGLEAEHKDLISQYAYQNYQATVNDRKSAREREEKIVELTKKRDYVMDILSILFVIFFFIVCILNYFLEVKDNSVMTMLIGQISAGVGLILCYYYGSSNN